MSSASEYNDAAASVYESSDVEEKPRSHSRPSSRRQSRTRTPLTPRKRRRMESVDPSRIRNYYFEGKYNDAYRVLYNEDVHRAAARFELLDPLQPHATQIGASAWSSEENSAFFAALGRLGKHDAPGITKAIGTKSLPETQELLLVLHDAAIKQADAKLTLRHVPAAIELGHDCIGQLDVLAEALAWYQEMHEASQEQAKYGKYWLVTSDIAEKIESTLNSEHSGASSAVPPSEAETLPRRGGRVIAGACKSCKLLKQKCDRGTPCSNCVRRNIDECVYPKLPAKSESPGPVPTAEQIDQGKTVDALSQMIPEAQLLNASMLLTLSRTLFMNRSPTLPSPWPHWSEIVSDLTEEPAIYRSAFNDLHTLVVSVTRRLMQTAIAQASSRIRSQRQRTKKSVRPFVKRRDVLTAVDVVGMKRNGHERWQGVARRCALRVVQGHSRREVSWSEVEKIMAPDQLSAEPPATDTEASDGPSTSFKRRAARSGTPLPMDRLALSGSESEPDDEDSNADSDISMLDDVLQPSSRQPTQPRDLHGRYTSTAPTSGDEQPGTNHFSLEVFDQEASRLGERALRESLDITPSFEGEPDHNADAAEEDDDLANTEDVVTEPNGWRSWTDYRHEWEEFEDPISSTKFASNQKALPSTPYSTTVASKNMVDPSRDESASSDDEMDKQRRKPRGTVELRAQNPRAYAALQERAARLADARESDDELIEESASDTDVDRDQPAQSVEIVHDAPHARNRDDSMDWDAFMDT